MVVVADFYHEVIYIDATYQVSFNCRTAGATVSLAGHENTRLPVTLELSYGEVSYTIEAPGYGPISESVLVNRHLLVTRTLAPLSRSVTVRSQPPGAQVLSGFRTVGTTPAVLRTTDRNVSLELVPPEQYPRLLRADAGVEFAVDQTRATVTHEFESRPTATVEFEPIGEPSVFQARAVVAGEGRSVDLLSGYGTPAPVESGELTMQVLKGLESIGTVTATLAEDRSYVVRLGMPQVSERTVVSASMLPGARAIPLEPDYLAEYRTERVEDGRVDKRDRGLIIIPAAALGVVAAGLIAGMPDGNYDDLSETESAALFIGGLIGGGVVGFLLDRVFFTEPDYKDVRVPLYQNANANDERREAWEKAVAEAEAYNRDLLVQHNAAVTSRNEEREAQGFLDFTAEVIDAQTGRQIPCVVEDASDQ